MSGSSGIATGLHPTERKAHGQRQIPRPGEESVGSDPLRLPQMSELPDADVLHRRFFDPWYKTADRERRGATATRPDIVLVAGFRDVPWEELSPIEAGRQR